MIHARFPSLVWGWGTVMFEISGCPASQGPSRKFRGPRRQNRTQIFPNPLVREGSLNHRGSNYDSKTCLNGGCWKIWGYSMLEVRSTPARSLCHKLSRRIPGFSDGWFEPSAQMHLQIDSSELLAESLIPRPSSRIQALQVEVCATSPFCVERPVPAAWATMPIRARRLSVWQPLTSCSWT